MKHRKIGLLLLAGTLLAGCSAQTSTDTSKENTVNTQQETAPETQTEAPAADTTEETKDDEVDIDSTEARNTSIVLEDYDKPVKITSAGTYNVTGSGQMIIVDAKKQDVTLVLDNVTLRNETMPTLYVKKAASVTIQLKGDNKMTTGTSGPTSAPTFEALDAALYSKADLIMEGSGSLSIDSGYEHGIKAKDTAVFKDGTYTIKAQNDGIHVNETAEFQKGTYTINCGGEGLEAKDTMTIQDGIYTINAQDDGINTASSLTINGGTITVISATNDAVDSNGDLIINGGDITAIGCKTPEGAFDTDNTPLEFNGGKILGIGSMGTTPTKTGQPVIQIGTSETIKSVEIRSEDGASVVKWDVPSYSGQTGALLLSDPALKSGSTYEVFVNGTSLDTVTLSDSVTTIGNVQTMGGKGGMGGRPGQMPDNFNGEQPGNFDGQMPEDFNGERPPRPDGSTGGHPGRPGRDMFPQDSGQDATDAA